MMLLTSDYDHAALRLFAALNGPDESNAYVAYRCWDEEKRKRWRDTVETEFRVLLEKAMAIVHEERAAHAEEIQRMRTLMRYQEWVSGV